MKPALVFALALLAAPAAQADIVIAWPAPGEPGQPPAVCTKASISVTGSTSAASDDVHLLLQPVGVNTFWVQCNALNLGGTWSSDAILGDQNQHYGALFRLIAVRNPQVALRCGDALPKLPAADEYSAPVVVQKTAPNSPGC